MNRHFLSQELNNNQRKNYHSGIDKTSVLIMPADFSVDRELENVSSVVVIEAQPSLPNAFPSSKTSVKSSQNSAVFIPSDLSIESHQVPILIADYSDELPDTMPVKSSVNHYFWHALFGFTKNK